MTEKPGVYLIRQISSGLVYIGSTSNISKRWSRHRKMLREKTHTNKKLQTAFNEMGESDFEFDILRLVSKERLLEVEQFWLNVYRDKSFNDSPTAGSSNGRKWSKQEYLKHERHTKLFGKLCENQKIMKKRGESFASNPTNHKLTLEQESLIRSEYQPRKVTMAFLASKYQVSLERIHAIIHQRKRRKC